MWKQSGLKTTKLSKSRYHSETEGVLQNILACFAINKVDIPLVSTVVLSSSYTPTLSSSFLIGFTFWGSRCLQMEGSWSAHGLS